MQYRMKTHQLPQSEVHALLNRSLTGSLSTIDSDGAPYSVPIHFVFLDGAIYFHGLPVRHMSVQWCGVRQSCLTYKRKNEGCRRQSLRNTHRSLQGGNCRLIW